MAPRPGLSRTPADCFVRDDIRSRALLLPARCDRLATLLLPVAGHHNAPAGSSPGGRFCSAKTGSRHWRSDDFRRLAPSCRTVVTPNRQRRGQMGSFRSGAERLFVADKWTEPPEATAFLSDSTRSILQTGSLSRRPFCLFVDQKAASVRQTPGEHCIDRIGDLKTWLFKSFAPQHIFRSSNRGQRRSVAAGR